MSCPVCGPSCRIDHLKPWRRAALYGRVERFLLNTATLTCLCMVAFAAFVIGVLGIR